MSVTITKLVDSNNQELKLGDANTGITPPITIHGTATKNSMIMLWLDKKLQDTHPTSAEDGKWTYKFTPASNELDLVAAEVSYSSSSNGTFKASYK
ncbi:hypothetical protein IRZ53_02505 [Pseudomonas fulva]|uniref:hypothetical protein n=1 Tax=Pseudomonas fulva TaxID=47880 RepID=UPI0018A889C4|nr:hypothetical protein [Pseudomonas fulva]MBF8672945.1 hypothetical protein [Pseudomonas fulva]MBF8695664.1 hypothetical protein [Pseudomonas fulva]